MNACIREPVAERPLLCGGQALLLAVLDERAVHLVLQHEASLGLGCDPDGVFSEGTDEHGFRK